MTKAIPFVVVYADPSWRFNDRLRQSKVKRSAEDQYELTMSVDEIAALGKPSMVFGDGRPRRPSTVAGFQIADDGFLCLWAPGAFILDGSASRVAQMWGYEPKQIVPWIKGKVGMVTPRDGCHDLPDAALFLQMGMGRVFRNVTEFLVICTRGKFSSLVKHHGTNGLILAPEDEVILAPRRKSPTRGVEHSTKPVEAYEAIEKVMPGPYLELFACEKRPGWTSVGSVFGELMTPEGVVPYEAPGKDPLPIGNEIIHPDPGIEWPV